MRINANASTRRSKERAFRPFVLCSNDVLMRALGRFYSPLRRGARETGTAVIRDVRSIRGLFAIERQIGSNRSREMTQKKRLKKEY